MSLKNDDDDDYDDDDDDDYDDDDLFIHLFENSSKHVIIL